MRDHLDLFGDARIAVVTFATPERLAAYVTIGELEDGEAVRVTDYWGEPTATPVWREGMTGRFDMPVDGIWPAAAAQVGNY